MEKKKPKTSIFSQYGIGRKGKSLPQGAVFLLLMFISSSLWAHRISDRFVSGTVKDEKGEGLVTSDVNTKLGSFLKCLLFVG